MTWDLVLTRKLIERRFGADQAERAGPSLRSIYDKQEYARYHYQEVEHLLKRFSSRHLTNKSFLQLALRRDEGRLPFDALMTKIGAHTTACIQSIHAIPDILSHVFYFSLGLSSLHPLNEQRISAKTVRALLGKLGSYREIVDTLHSLTHEGQALHLGALSNHGKHRSVVQPLLNEDLTGERVPRHEIRISGFRYNDTDYPAISIGDLLEPEYARSSRAVVSAGEMLNRMLGTSIR